MKQYGNPTISTLIDTIAVNVFAGNKTAAARAALRGNPCRVAAWSAEPQCQPDPCQVTQCQTWITDRNTAAVRCWTPTGHPIELCGHGMLGCGHYWAQSGQPLQHLVMGNTRASYLLEADISWLGLPPLATETCPIPQWAARIFGHGPVAAASAGGPTDYLILVWPPGFALQTLPVPSADLMALTARSIIATCLENSSSGGQVQLRYFAPQHGIAEDIATGSAMRVLASYWHSQGQPAQLQATQCSPRGGELRSRIEPATTWIGGKVTSSVRSSHEH